TGNKKEWFHFFELRCPKYKHIDWVVGDNGGEDTWSFSKKTFISVQTGGHYKKGMENNGEFDWQKLNEGQSEIHMMDLAEKIYDAIEESKCKYLEAGEWHIPYFNTIDFDKIEEIIKTLSYNSLEENEIFE